MKYDLILSDPAWRQSKGGKKKVRPNSSGEELEYTTITLDDIKEIQKQARDLSQDNHICFLWTIDKYLHESEQMMLDLGYKLHARMIWNKVTGIPAAFTIRYGHEYLLYFYHGKLLPVAKSERGKIHSVFTEQVKRHSQKPNVSYNIINRLYPETTKVELFCRYKRDGWHGWGNEIESDIKLNGFEKPKVRREINLWDNPQTQPTKNEQPLGLRIVSKQREQLIAFAKFGFGDLLCTYDAEKLVDKFLESN